MDTMKKFKFSTTNNSVKEPLFLGPEFYKIYKEANFLKYPNNIEKILSKGYELRQMLKQVQPGEVVALQEMYLYDEVPLLIKKTGPNVIIKKYEFTTNRLSGLTAAYAYANRKLFPKLQSSEAEYLGLKWDDKSKDMCRLFLSAVSGTEHFYDQFQFWPLICALRKLQLKKITLELVIKMAKIKNSNNVRMADDLIKNLDVVKMIWLLFPNSSYNEMVTLIIESPPELKKLLGKII